MKPLRVLVADDEEEIRSLIQLWLAAAGHAVICVGNGQEATKLLGRLHFDLIVTDVIMPDGDGLQLIQDFKAAQPAARILAISGGGKYMARDDCLKMAKGLGAHAAVMKPFAQEQLLAGIRRALETESETATA